MALLAEAIGRAVGEDVQAFGQRELMNPLGIPASAWSWKRDPAGHVQGFYGVNMRPDDFGRLGELMRRGGVWRGRRLLSSRYVREAVTPSATNGCYGWLIWVNAGAPCIGPTITERPVSLSRDFPDLPADMYRFSGLFGQLVTVFPSQGIVVVRTGQDRGLLFSGGSDWEHDLYAKVLGSVTDQRIAAPGDAPQARPPAARRRLRVPDRAARARPVRQGRGPGPAAWSRAPARARRAPTPRVPACQPPWGRDDPHGLPGTLAGTGSRPLHGSGHAHRRAPGAAL